MQTILIAATTLLACFLITGTVTAQQDNPNLGAPPDFNGTPPPGWNGNMTGPPDFNGTRGDGGMPPDFNGTRPFPSGNPRGMDDQSGTQSGGNQVNDILIAVVGVVVVAAAVAVATVVLIRKKKNRQETSPEPLQST